MPTFVRTQEVEHEIGARGRFGLRVTSSDVEIRGADHSVARVRITLEIRASSEAEADELLEHARFRVTEADGVLEVSEPSHGERGLGALARIFGRGHSATAAVEVEVPRGAEIQYDGVSADLTATGLTGRQRYRTVSGDLVLDRVSGDIGVQGVSGDVSLRADGPVSLDANTVSGDLSAFAPAFEAVRVVTVSGDAEVEGELRGASSHRIETVSGDLALGVLGGLTLEVRGLSTDVHIDLPHRAEGSRHRRHYVVEGGGAHVSFSSMSGDVSVRSSRRAGRPPTPPPPPAPPPPASPIPPAPPTAPGVEIDPEDQLAVLQALERGEIDVDEAARRLSGERPDA